MAVTLLRLKLALLRNGLRRSRANAALFWTVGLFALGVAAVVATQVAASASGPDGGDALITVYGLVWLGWLVGPLLAGGLDETLDPRKLELLPIPAEQRVLGLLLTSTVGVGGAGTLVALLGALGWATSLGAALVAAVAVVLALLVCVTTARVATTVTSTFLTSRRGRDLAATLGTLLALALYAGSQLAQGPDPTVHVDVSGAATAAAAWLQFTPTGAVAAAVDMADAGQWGPALGVLAGIATIQLGLLLTWLLLTGEPRERAAPASRSRAAHAKPGPVLRALPPGRFAAVLFRELHYLRRDPTRRTQLITSVGYGAMVLLPAVSRALDQPGVTVLAAALPIMLVNDAPLAFGYDGPALWSDVVAPGRLSTNLIAKQTAVLPVVVVMTGLVAGGLGLITGGTRLVPATIVLGIVAWMTTNGVAAVISVAGPVAVVPVDQRASMASQPTPGRGCAVGALALAGMATAALLSLPIALPAYARRDDPAGLLATAAVGLLYGALVWSVGLVVAHHRLTPREPELLAAIHPRR